MNSLIILILYLGVGSVFGLSPVCREEHRLRSDLQFKYAYKESLPTSIDIDFSQRSGDSIHCTGTSVVASGVTKTMSCESVARSEGPGMDRFGWAKQLAVSTKGSVKIYSGDLNASPTEFTTGTECGSSIKMALGGHYMAAVCKKAIRVYRFDGTTWHDHDEVAFANAVDHELQLDLNHEDYMIVSEPSSSTVKIYKLGAITTEVQSFSGDGKVAAAVNCRGSVFAYELSNDIRIKQLSQKDGTWSDLKDIPFKPTSLSMSNDVLAVGMTNAVNVYMFANSGTEYAEYKVLKGTQSFGKLVSIEHEDLAVLDDTRVYLFHDGASTKCRALQRLDDGVCIDCGAGHTNAHDNTDSTCLSVQCTSSQYALGGVCKACPAGSTGVAGPASVDSECTCAAGKSFNATAGTCDAILCAVDERVVSNACEACPAGSTNAVGDDSSGADTNCDATLCAANEHVVSNVCTLCVDGSTNAVGDDASGADTACDITHQCLVNQFYDTANHCQACPAGTNKAVAVDSTGGNSTCDDVLCLADHSVQVSYISANTKKYGSTSCTSASDCQTKCTADSGCAGYTTSKTVPLGAGFNHMCYLVDDGTVQCLGDNSMGQLGTGSNTAQSGFSTPSLGKSATAIHSGSQFSCAILVDKTVKCWGISSNGALGSDYDSDTYKATPVTLTGYTDVEEIGLFYPGGCARLTDGSVKCWKDYGGIPKGTQNIGGQAKKLEVGEMGTACVILTDNKLKCWGYNSNGELGVGDNTNKNSPTEISFTGRYAVDVSCGGEHCCVVLDDGNVRCSGKGGSGKLGYGNTDNRNTYGPNVDLPSGKKAVKISCNYYNTYVTFSDGTATSWGSSSSFRLGYSSSDSVGDASGEMGDNLSLIAFSTTVSFIESFYNTRAAVLDDGKVIVWGDQSNGQSSTANTYWISSLTELSLGTNKKGALAYSASYGPLITGTGTSFTKNKGCTACHADATRPAGDLEKGATTQCSCKPNFEGDGSTCTACGANQESAAGGDKCKCSAGSEGDGSACQTCPANSNAVAGPIKDQCVKNEGAIWHDEVVNGAADAGACTATLDCTSKAATTAGCIQPYEDGGVLQATSPCCKIEKPQKCGCDENHRVSSNTCVACPTGEVRPAGDDPDNGDTYCNTEGITLAFTHNGNSDFVYNGQNDPDIALKAGQKYTFLRDSSGHPLRIVSAADCSGKGCDAGKWTSLPTSSLTSVDSVQGTSNAVYTFKKAGTYYYLCTAHPDMVGKITVTWDACSMSTYGSVSLSSSCQIQTSVSLTGAMTINVASLRSSGEKLMLSMSDSMSPAINAGVYALTINGFEITDIKSDNKMVESTTGTIKLSGVDLKDNPRNTGSGSLFKTTGGHIVGESLVIDNSKGEVFEGASGGDISLADSIISNSATIIKQNGGAVVVRSVNVTGGKLADMNDATSAFEAVFTDGGDGIVAVRSAVQVERSGFKNHANAPIQFDSRSCTKCKRELVVSETFFDDAKAVNAQTDASNKPRVKIIESDFTSSGSVVSDNGIELYVIDEIVGKEMTTTETKTETCLPHQCSHKPLATSCKVSSGKGTQCICDVGVATYKAEEKTLEKQTTVEEILSMLFATAETADRVVKLVDQNVRYIPTQATPEAAKSNILLLKPTNTDGEFQSEKTILLKPDSGSVCATFQTWLCAELTACHYSNGTITADCDGNKILTGSSNAARRFRLRAPHPEDPNCNGAISNLKQQCTDGSGGFYSRCVQYAQFHHDKCVCMDGMKPNSNGNACISEDNLCKVNERVLNKRCVPCEGLLTNKAGDDLTGSDTTCDDVICREGFHSDGNGKCTICAAGSFNLNGDIAYDASTSTNGPATSCCGSGKYEFDVDLTAGTRTCKACDDATDSLRNRFGANGAGLHCCRGTRLSSDDALKCDRILDYYKKVCQKLETNANTCKTY